MQNPFNKRYNIFTEKSKEEILATIRSKIEAQKKLSRFFSDEPVDYRAFKIENGQVKIERFPSFFNPFAAMGAIYFNFKEPNNKTEIECKCEAFLYMVLLYAFLVLFFWTAMTIIVLLIAKYSLLKFTFFVLATWLVGFGGTALIFLINKNRLVRYSRIILKDIGIEPYHN